ncbi:MAG: sigma 54-interacting transcriptional regulator [Terriglobia bacterium]
MEYDESDNELYRIFSEVGFVACSDRMLGVLRQASKAARLSDITVLIEGETGTGKQVLARAIQELDQKRRSYPFITAHCSTINETLAESELFGHERGAFSGAVSSRKGLFQAAQNGTLLLDDVNDLPLALQAKLLDVLQRSVVRPVGSDREVPIDVRIIAASNRPLAQLVRQNGFRADLYYRLKVVHLVLPPLRERTAELRRLILEFARRHERVYPGIMEVESDLTSYLASQNFEGNVRELEHDVQRVLFCKKEGASLRLSDWMAQRQDDDKEVGLGSVRDAARILWRAVSTEGLPFAHVLRLTEKHLLEIALSNNPRGRRELSKHLKTSERTLYHKLQSHGLTRQINTR